MALSKQQIFQNEIFNDVAREAEVSKMHSHEAFTQYYSDVLLEDVIDGFEPAYHNSKFTQVDGYYLDEADGILSLFITDYSEDPDKRINNTDAERLFKRAIKFYSTSESKEFFLELEESRPDYGLAYEIFKERNTISSVKVYLFSSRFISDRIKEFSREEKNGISFSYHIFDMSRLQRILSSSQQKEEMLIDFDEVSSIPVYALPAHLNTEGYKSYLAVMPGVVLAELYDRYQTRLLEQNVRTYLQARGKVNKGIRTTILEYPEKFFAYNNGLTTTAEDIETEVTEQGLRIKSIRNLQIVNGGQTTASIYSAYRKDKAELKDVFVQMKLTVIVPEQVEAFVPKISEYANSQNKVSAADFFSNHPFHVRIEGFSRRVYAPINPETNKESKWFYERARGQYLDLLAYKTKGETTKAQLEFPKKQLFTKTALSKYENVWCQKPHIVSKGAQYSMQEFANSVDELWAKDDKQFNEYNYKEYVSKAIIFKSTEKIVSSASWYQNAFRAQTVDYTLSFLSSLIEDTFKKFDFNAVWQLQSLPKEIETIIADISSLVYARITAPPAGNANVAQWCKKEFCWTKLKDSKAIIDICVIDKYLIDPSKKIVEQKEAKKVQKIYNEFEAVEIVYTLKPEWQRIEDFGIEQGKLSAKCLGLIRTAKHPMKVPTEKQAVALVKILDRLKDLGLEV